LDLVFARDVPGWATGNFLQVVRRNLVPSEVGRRSSLAAYAFGRRRFGGFDKPCLTSGKPPRLTDSLASFTSTLTGGIIAAVPATFYAAGLMRKTFL
jgi:hypothetical protein